MIGVNIGHHEINGKNTSNKYEPQMSRKLHHISWAYLKKMWEQNFHVLHHQKSYFMQKYTFRQNRKTHTFSPKP